MIFSTPALALLHLLTPLLPQLHILLLWRRKTENLYHDMLESRKAGNETRIVIDKTYCRACMSITQY